MRLTLVDDPQAHPLYLAAAGHAELAAWWAFRKKDQGSFSSETGAPIVPQT